MTPRHRGLRQPAQCPTTSKWRSSCSSLGLGSYPFGPLHLINACGIRNYSQHPGTTSPSSLLLEVRLWAPSWERRKGGSPKGESPHILGGSLPVPGHWAGRQQAAGSGFLFTAPGSNPGLHEEAGDADGRGGWPGPWCWLPGRAGESPHGPAGRERLSGLPGPTDP